MLKNIRIKNFRSLSEANLELGKFTLLTGSNNSGKSSFIYALLALKNIITNPNVSLDSFFTFPFINLGGFNQTVTKKRDNNEIILGITYSNKQSSEQDYDFFLSLGKQESSFNLSTPDLKDAKLSVSFPYPGNSSMPMVTKYGDGGRLSIDWYGTNVSVSIVQQSPIAERYAPEIQRELVSYIPEIASIDGVSIRRGFTKPFFGVVPLSTQIWSEDEIATALSTDRDLEGTVAHYLEKIVDRTFNVRVTPGTSNFYLQTRDRDTAFVSDLVNEGLGTNQLVTLLVKVLTRNTRFICIDEPEIHLHPTIINRLVDTLIEIAENEEKQFLISTHSEHFVNALLRNVVDKNIDNNDLKAYYLSKDNKGLTKIETQAINDKGQMEGGLKNFYEAELENLKDLFKL